MQHWSFTLATSGSVHWHSQWHPTTAPLPPVPPGPHEWFVPLPPTHLTTDIDSSIRNTGLQPTPTDQQLKPIQDWIARSQLADAWKLVAPDDDLLRVDWAHIWFAFEEYVAYDHDTSQLTVAVIGYD